MNANLSPCAQSLRITAIALGLMLALPSIAQQDDMRGMQMAPPATSSSTPAHASSSYSMQDMDMPMTQPKRKANQSAKDAKNANKEKQSNRRPRQNSPQRTQKKQVRRNHPNRHSRAGGNDEQKTGAHTMQGMEMPSMQGMPMPAKPSPAPASGSSSGPSMQGMQMQGTGKSSTQGTQMHGTPPMPRQSSKPAELQHLDFGNMIGVRPEPGGLAEGMQAMQTPSMQGMDMSSMQGGNAPPDARSPDYSDGYRYTDMPGMAMPDHAKEGMLLIDQLEVAYDHHGHNSTFIDGEFWYGEDFNKLWLKFEGEQAHGKLEDLRTEALWYHATSAYWGTQLGMREDFGEGPNRTWAAFGVQGLAPYWFETEATFYVSQNGRTAARVQFEYEELLTQRLILQPKFEVNLYGKDDPQRGIGSGLSDAELGLRLRYEFHREFAPYVGVVWRQRFGRTADLYRAQGEPAGDLQFVAGIHFWF